jgi:hypothetical protein
MKYIFSLLGIYIAYSIITAPSPTEPPRTKSPPTTSETKIKYQRNKWDDILEYTIMKHNKLDDYVECKTRQIDENLFTVCRYVVSGYKKKPVFVHSDDGRLGAVNGSARIPAFLHYDEIYDYDFADYGPIDIGRVQRIFGF